MEYNKHLPLQGLKPMTFAFTSFRLKILQFWHTRMSSIIFISKNSKNEDLRNDRIHRIFCKITCQLLRALFEHVVREVLVADRRFTENPSVMNSFSPIFYIFLYYMKYLFPLCRVEFYASHLPVHLFLSLLLLDERENFRMPLWL